MFSPELDRGEDDRMHLHTLTPSRDTRLRMRGVVALLLSVVAATAAGAAVPQEQTIGQLIAKGEAEEAHCRLREELARSPNAQREAALTLNLAIAEVALGRLDAARMTFDRADRLYAALPDEAGRWVTNWILAELERREGQTEVAAFRHEQALTALSAAATGRFSLDALKAVGDLSGFNVAQLPIPLDDMSELFKPILLRFMEAMQREGYAAVRLELGDPAGAEAELDRAAELMSVFPGVLDDAIAIRRGDVSLRRGNFDAARASYRAALQKPSFAAQLLGHTDELRVFGRLQELERLAGRIPDALSWNDRALEHVRSRGNRRREASLLGDRAALLLLDGRAEAAEATLLEALAIADKHGRDFDRAVIHASLGALYKFRGRYGRAANAFEKSLDIYRRIDMPYVEAPTWITLAELYYLLDDPATAATALANAREAARRAGFPLAAELADVVEALGRSAPGAGGGSDVAAKLDQWLSHPGAADLLPADALTLLRAGARAHAAPDEASDPLPAIGNGLPAMDAFPALLALLRGRAALLKGDTAAARAIFNGALRLEPAPELRTGLLALIGTTYWQEGRRSEGTRYFTEAVKTLELPIEDLRAEELIGSYLGNTRQAYFDILVERLASQKKFAEAFDITERARARMFLQLVGNARTASRRDAASELVRTAEALRMQITEWQRDPTRSQHPELEDARKRYAALMTRVKAAHPEYAALSRVEPVSVEEVRRELAPGTTLISYFITTAGAHAWILDAKSFRHVPLPLDATAVARIACWADRVGPRVVLRGVRPANAACDAEDTAEQAYDLLFAPLRETIATRKLIIVPHGKLHFVPFAALRNRATGRYLVQDYTVTYAPSASAIRFLRAKESGIARRALVLGNPDAPEGKLAGADEEAKAVARALGAEALLGARADESVMRQLGGKYDVLHVAAHGTYDARNPLFSHIALTPSKEHDGHLDVHEILTELDLANVNLVVLSACDTALGTRSRGDDIVGLTRALLYAGTPGVVSTLWRVDDERTALFMRSFYEHFIDGATAADALRAAQLSMIESGEEPRVWAAFTLTGDPQGRWT